MPTPLKPVATVVNLTPRARELVETIRAATGVPATTAMERYLEFLAGMPAKFQLAVLNRDAQVQDELLVGWVREHLAGKGLQIDPLEAGDVDARVRHIIKQLHDLQATYKGQIDAVEVTKKKRG